LSNIINMIVPIMVCIIAVLIYFFVSSEIFSINTGFEDFERITEIEYKLNKSKYNISSKEDMLLDTEYQNELKDYVKDEGLEIIVFKNGDILFASMEGLSLIDLELTREKGRYVKLLDRKYIKKNMEFKFRNNDLGQIILLQEVTTKNFSLKTFIIIISIVFIISFILTNLILTKYMSNKVVKPINKLVAATKEISMGNLRSEIIEEGDDEIARLFLNFEKMRIKLRESINKQVKMDENRKIIVTSISHDLKTPITSIKGYVQAILDGIAKEPKKVDKYLKNVLKKAEIMDKMIEDLFLYSKLDLKQMAFHIENIDIIEYFDYCINDIMPELNKKNIVINFEHNLKESKNVLVDREKFQRVIMNILDNSIKYIDKEKGKIDIFIRDTASTIIIEIKDNGMGIEKEELQSIFDRFYRSNVARGKASGSGLGLAIAKQIVTELNGNIWAKSSLNNGTSVMISLKKGDKVKNEKNIDS